jgi:DNA (cytosine-5)-methyltransferase 1
VGNRFTFADLFAGIGGTRIAFQKAGGKCVFSSEWDEHACKTYEANFGEKPRGDITRIRPFEMPQHDVLAAGFPCQPFSIAGVTKHTALGNHHGFRHETQGTLFFEVAKIIDECRPRAFLLENVKHLIRHDGGRTFEIILKTLKKLKYDVHWQVIDARHVVPQHRERIYIAGFRKKTPFEFPTFPERKQRVRTILEPDPDPKYQLTDHLWEYLQDYTTKHRAKGNGFQYGLVDLDSVTRTLSARYYKDGSEILIPMEKGPPRRLTPRECARLMGFPKKFKIPVSDTQAYKQFGNSIVVPVMAAVAKQIVTALEAARSDDRYVTSKRNDVRKNGHDAGTPAERAPAAAQRLASSTPA